MDILNLKFTLGIVIKCDVSGHLHISATFLMEFNKKEEAAINQLTTINMVPLFVTTLTI